MKNIAVVFGGFSSEYEVSLKSGKFIYDNLKDNPKLNVYQICISKESSGGLNSVHFFGVKRFISPSFSAR